MCLRSYGQSCLHLDDFLSDGLREGFRGMGGDTVEGFEPEVRIVGQWKSECTFRGEGRTRIWLGQGRGGRVMVKPVKPRTPELAVLYCS